MIGGGRVYGVNPLVLILSACLYSQSSKSDPLKDAPLKVLKVFFGEKIRCRDSFVAQFIFKLNELLIRISVV